MLWPRPPKASLTIAIENAEPEKRVINNAGEQPHVEYKENFPRYRKQENVPEDTYKDQAYQYVEYPYLERGK